MAKKLGFFVILSICLLIVEFTRAQEESPSESPVGSPDPEFLADSPPPPSSSPQPKPSQSPASSPKSSASSPQPKSSQTPASSPKSSQSPASSPQPDSSSPSPEPESPSEAPSPPPPPPSEPEFPSAPSPSPESAPAPAPSDDDDDSDDDPEQETEYFPAPAPAPELGIAEDIKASEDSEEYDDPSGEDKGMSGWKKAGIAIGMILGVGAIIIGALVYKKRRDNLSRARYTYFEQGEFL